MIRAALLALTLAAPAAAQEAVTAQGAVLRVLDKQTGAVDDLTVPNGTAVEVGLLSIGLGECRYPAGNPSGDAFAQLTIHYRDDAEPVFRGWMIASSPALSAMEHPRYDVWPLRCTTS
ncbi:DUF2155 domain-containing protein [Histidinibacterium aquaticum]|uniref:DUF2155 domain-containing protein n=1 Tax=Histidinibacterium aquaticum TaxID=2613962 RepID=A0A5J5GC86_9RHOB|nr:DUF2155 domain-containing protein [Histidinibacterium aquaticum]KAA9005641.1 DUF2155 domain-containing protein [Histidinibacterium aquaticum]